MLDPHVTYDLISPSELLPPFRRMPSLSEYRRWLVPGATHFFTLVTYERCPIFRDRGAVHLLGEAMRQVRSDLQFRTIALVVLPDHLHCVWSLPNSDADFSTRWKRIKREFTIQWRAKGGISAGVSRSRRLKGERGVWQRRFWEHFVRDEDDLERCCDYVHYNPVKHGYAEQPADWPWSTFHRFVERGHYPAEWGRSLPNTLKRERPELAE